MNKTGVTGLILPPYTDFEHARFLAHDRHYNIYKLGYVKRGSTAFKVQKDRCGIPSVARALLGPEGLVMR